MFSHFSPQNKKIILKFQELFAKQKLYDEFLRNEQNKIF